MLELTERTYDRYLADTYGRLPLLHPSGFCADVQELDCLVVAMDRAVKTAKGECTAEDPSKCPYHGHQPDADSDRREIEEVDMIEDFPANQSVPQPTLSQKVTEKAADYLARLKADGNIPKTLERFTGNSKATLNAWTKSAAITPAQTKKIQTALAGAIGRIQERQQPCVYANHGVLDSILTSHYKNLMETNLGSEEGNGSAWKGKSRRIALSREKFNFNPGIEKTHTRDGVKYGPWEDGDMAAQFEKYGTMADKKDMSDDFNGGASLSYGDACIRFRPDRVSCTFTAGDSLGNHCVASPSLMCDPSPSALPYDRLSDPDRTVDDLNRVNTARDMAGAFAVNYMETQMHGDLTADTVESINLSGESGYSYDRRKHEIMHGGKPVFSADGKNAIRRNGIAVHIDGKKVEI